MQPRHHDIAHPRPDLSRVVAVLNGGAGRLATGSAAACRREVDASLKSAGIRAEIRWSTPGNLERVLADTAAERPSLVLVGGGDGTVSTAAHHLRPAGVPLSVLPLGTFNNFAKDLGLPLSLDAAARAVASGRVQRIDTGDIAGRTFINNTSIGLYPHAVLRRNALQQQLGMSRSAAMAVSLAGALFKLPKMDVALTVDGTTRNLSTSFVFMGNNRYLVAPLSVIRRADLTGGCLGVFCSEDTSRLTLLRTAWAAFTGRVERESTLKALSASQVVLDAGRRRVKLGLDGEVREAALPVTCRILPASLTVVAP